MKNDVLFRYKEQFDKNGYFVFKNFLTKDFVSKLIDEINNASGTVKYFDNLNNLRRIEKLYDKGTNLINLNEIADACKPGIIKIFALPTISENGYSSLKISSSATSGCISPSYLKSTFFLSKISTAPLTFEVLSVVGWPNVE